MIWRPDTCGCVFEYDGRNDAEHLTRVVNLCARHENHDDAYADNVMKNRAVKAVAEAYSLEDASVVPWAYGEDRTLTVGHPPGRSLSGVETVNLHAALAQLHASRIRLEE